MAHSTSGIDRSPSRSLLVACGILASFPASARAESHARERAVADALFREGKTLMEQGETKRACAKLAESHRLDPRGGTLLNLAHCHETEGKLATALLEYEEALEMAFAAHRTDRIEFVQARMAALQDKVPKLVAQVPSNSRVQGLEVRHNGALLPDAAFGTPVHVDPGQHTLVASAPGSKPWSSTIRIDVGETATLTVPSLDRLSRPSLNQPPASPQSEQESQVPTTRVAGYSLLGAGLAGLGVGLYFGSVAFSRASERDEHCSGTSCDARGMQLDQQGANAATVANIGFVAAALGLGAGTYFLLQEEDSRPAPEDRDARQLHVAPVAGRNGGGLSLGGTW